MLNPCANSRLKRKMFEKQTQTQTQCRVEEEQEHHVNETDENNTGAENTVLRSPQDHSVRSGAIFILDNASLKKGLVKKEWKILNSQDDANFLLKQDKNVNDYRPDIVFEALRGIIDSPLNKYGLVNAIFVKIDGGALFEIKPHVRIPRTCKRFCGLIVELLQKSCVRAKNTNEVLLRVVEEPVGRHLPVNSHIIGLSYSSQKLIDIHDYVSVISDDVTPVFVVGAMVNGKVKRDHTHDYISGPDFGSPPSFLRKKLLSVLSESGKTSSLIGDISIVKRYASESSHAIPVTSDDEALAKTNKEVKNEKVHFIWTQFSELQSYFKNQAEDSENLNKRLAEMMALVTCQKNFDKGKGFKLSASAELKEILARMDARIHDLYMSLPTNAMLIICTGHGDTAVVRRLRRMLVEQSQSNLCREKIVEILEEVQARAEVALCFVGVKH